MMAANVVGGKRETETERDCVLVAVVVGDDGGGGQR